MSTLRDPPIENSDSKLATGPTEAGMDSITNTHGMHPSTPETASSNAPSNTRQANSCSQPGCTSDHSGKPHE